MNAPSYSPPTPIQLGQEYGFGLEREAMRVLTGELPAPDGELIRQRQGECRAANNEHALSLWSRLRWMWVVNAGKAEVR